MCSDERNYQKHINGRKHKHKVKLLKESSSDTVIQTVGTNFTEFGINSIDELKNLSDARISKLREELAKTGVEQRRKKILKVLDPMTPYRYELINLMKNNDAEGAIELYYEI